MNTPHRAVGLKPTATTPARRTLLRAGLTGAAVLGAASTGISTASAAPAATATRPRPTTPAAALRELAAGNRRWRTFREQHPDETSAVRTELTSGQHPFALILGCIDSRVPPELVFDQGLGDLMTVRSGGEVLDEAVLGSVAYGVLELDIPLVMVLGHQSCGAVKAAVESDESGERLPPISSTWPTRSSRPSTAAWRATPASTPRSTPTYGSYARGSPRSPTSRPRSPHGQLAIVGARYELNTQRVRSIV